MQSHLEDDDTETMVVDVKEDGRKMQSHLEDDDTEAMVVDVKEDGRKMQSHLEEDDDQKEEDDYSGERKMHMSLNYGLIFSLNVKKKTESPFFRKYT